MSVAWAWGLLLAWSIGGLALVNNSDHLVVLSHGIMGGAKDLAYLAEQLRSRGCLVLVSKANALLNSLHGIERGAKNLRQEIDDIILQSADDHAIRRISFVGNSLGGIYARYAVKLYSENKPESVRFHKFMSIGTPHLAVSFDEHNYLHQEFGIPIPNALKRIVAKTMGTTGRELFMLDDGGKSKEEPLLVRMATDEAFLSPLRQFSERRLYANLKHDFVVPLGTAAFLSKAEVVELRAKHGAQSGIVEVLTTEPASPTSSSSSSTLLHRMKEGLDSLGWQKHIVHFPGILPIAHNKIAALRKDPEFLFTKILGTSEGDYVMEHAALWLTAPS